MIPTFMAWDTYGVLPVGAENCNDPIIYITCTDLVKGA